MKNDNTITATTSGSSRSTEHEERSRQDIPSNDFLNRYSIGVYLQDVTALLLADRNESPLVFIAQYFNKVSEGSHISDREFAFINATPRNRLAFINQFEHVYSDIQDAVVMSWKEYHQLLCQVCIDFPEHIVQILYHTLKQQSTPGIDDTASESSSEELTSAVAFKDFKLGFRCFFIFSDFLLLVLAKLFGNDYGKEIDSIMLNARAKSLIRTCESDNNNKCNGNNSDEAGQKHFLALPHPDSLSVALDEYIAPGYTSRLYVNMNFNFDMFCMAIYDHVQRRCEGNVLSIMDQAQLPLSAPRSTVTATT